jgi:hypothetical protein
VQISLVASSIALNHQSIMSIVYASLPSAIRSSDVAGCNHWHPACHLRIFLFLLLPFPIPLSLFLFTLIWPVCSLRLSIVEVGGNRRVRPCEQSNGASRSPTAITSDQALHLSLSSFCIQLPTHLNVCFVHQSTE